MRPLIIGGKGFLGSNLARRLANAGHAVGVLDLPEPETRAWDAYARGPAGFPVPEGETVSLTFELYEADLSRHAEVQRVFDAFKPDVVVHLAAVSTMQVATDAPMRTWRTNVLGTAVVLELCRARNLPVVVASCYDELTRAITPGGFKTFRDLAPGDTVLCLDRNTGEVTYGTVEEVVVQDYSGPMVRFHGKRLDFLVTPNHRMLDGLVFREASCQVPPHGWELSTGTWTGRGTVPELSQGAWNAKKFTGRFDASLLYLLGIFIGDGVVQHQKKVRPSKTGWARAQYLALARDGQTGRFSRPVVRGPVHDVESESNTVFLYIPDNDACRPRVERALSQLGIEYHRWKHAGEGALWFSSYPIAHLFEEAGTHATEKRIPRWALELPRDLLRPLLDGVLDSDGSRGRIVTTASPFLVRDLVELSLKCGLTPSFSFIPPPKNPPVIRGRPIRSTGAYHVSLSNPSRRILPKHRSVVQYEGKVWCVRVRTHGNLLVERSGRVAFCGNSDKAYGVGNPRPFREDWTPLRPRYPYDVSKACQDLMADAYHNTYGLPVVVTRACNYYGPADLHWNRLVPRTFRCVARGESPVLYKGMESVKREWMHVHDVCDAYELLAKKLVDDPLAVSGEAFNIGTGDVLANEEMVRRLLETAGSSLVPKVEDSGFPELGDESLDHSKIASLGWIPKVPLDEGLASTWRWYRSYFDTFGWD